MATQIIRDDHGTLYRHKEKPSVLWKPMRRVSTPERLPSHWEAWENNLYSANVERFELGNGIDDGPFVRIGIATANNAARHDWREFQWIKNDICGPEWEAIELYPSESRLLDPSNYYYLWVFPPKTLTLGIFAQRHVLGTESKAPQRPFAAGKKEWTP